MKNQVTREKALQVTLMEHTLLIQNRKKKPPTRNYNIVGIQSELAKEL
jgi:hypothetical protein